MKTSVVLQIPDADAGLSIEQAAVLNMNVRRVVTLTSTVIVGAGKEMMIFEADISARECGVNREMIRRACIQHLIEHERIYDRDRRERIPYWRVLFSDEVQAFNEAIWTLANFNFAAMRFDGDKPTTVFVSAYNGAIRMSVEVPTEPPPINIARTLIDELHKDQGALRELDFTLERERARRRGFQS